MINHISKSDFSKAWKCYLLIKKQTFFHWKGFSANLLATLFSLIIQLKFKRVFFGNDIRAELDLIKSLIRAEMNYIMFALEFFFMIICSIILFIRPPMSTMVYHLRGRWRNFTFISIFYNLKHTNQSQINLKIWQNN